MHRPTVSSMAVSALALTAIVTVIAPRAFPSGGDCDGIKNDRQRHDCKASLLPKSYSVHAMGMEAYGGGRKHSNDATRSVAKIKGPTTGTPDRKYKLTTAYKTTSV